MHVALPQDGVQESVAQPAAVGGAVVVSAGTETGDQRMIGDRLVVAVVGRALLLPKNFDRKAVDVDRGLADAAVGARRAEESG
jgi:hypothetical protein